MKSLQDIPIRKIEVEGVHTFSSDDDLNIDARGFLENMLDAYEGGKQSPKEVQGVCPERLYPLHRGVMKMVEFGKVGDSACLVELSANKDLNSWKIREYAHPEDTSHVGRNLMEPMMPYAALQQRKLGVGV